jgi:ABC-type uncharacterized transport system substrate-binding protein
MALHDRQTMGGKQDMKKGFLCLFIFIGIVGLNGCSDHKPANKMKKIISIELTESGLSAVMKKNMAAELAENGFIEKKDYTFELKSALGDNATLISLIDAAKNEKPDLLITFQPQPLFAAIKRAPELNKVFGIITDPFVLGGGKSDTDHLPHLTGLYMEMAYDKLAAFLTKLNPAPKTIGLIYLLGEDNSIKRMEKMSAALSQYGIKLIAQGYTTQSEINSAATVLFNQKLDGIIRFPDSNDTQVLTSLKPLAQKAKIPIYFFGVPKDDLLPTLSVQVDFNQVSKIFWNLAARTLKGEELAKIPFESSKNLKVVYHISKKEFDSCKIRIPEEGLKDAVLIP